LPGPVLIHSITGLPFRFYLAETVAAVDGFIAAGLEGDFGFFTALGAYSREHLALGAVSVAETLGFPCLTAFRTSFGLVGIASGLEEFLVFGAMCKGSTAIHTCKGLILKTHWMTSSPRY
jgi:hypothetical protein